MWLEEEKAEWAWRTRPQTNRPLSEGQWAESWTEQAALTFKDD